MALAQSAVICVRPVSANGILAGIVISRLSIPSLSIATAVTDLYVVVGVGSNPGKHLGCLSFVW